MASSMAFWSIILSMNSSLSYLTFFLQVKKSTIFLVRVGFFKSESLCTRSFFMDTCSKFSMSTEMNRFMSMNWPKIIIKMKKIVDETESVER